MRERQGEGEKDNDEERMIEKSGEGWGIGKNAKIRRERRR